MRVTVVYLLDGTVVEDRIEGDRIVCKIHEDGRGFVKVDGDVYLYRQVETITRYDS